MQRKPVIAGNWKMHRTRKETEELAASLRRELDGYEDVEMVVCPPFTSLDAAAQTLKGSSIRLGAQNVHWDDEGAYTGEVSTKMLEDCGCEFVILGHSERRQLFKETDEQVNLKLRRALESSLIPILCVGETLQERARERVEDVVLGQLEQAVDKLTAESLSRIIVAYEPVWAIGTGETATPETAEEVHFMIREWLAEVFSQELSERLRILYGGSVKPGNISGLMAQPNIDGALVGGASLDADSFAGIVRF
jgi:triosephosphate isomerase (TIM)